MKETGACPFCGQEVMVQVPETASDEELVYAAAMACDCGEAKYFRKKEKLEKDGRAYVESVLRQDVSEQRISCKVIPVLQEIIPLILAGDIENVSAKIAPEISVKISFNEKAAKVDVTRKETITTKI